MKSSKTGSGELVSSKVSNDLNILYIVGFYGTPPLNYFSKYVKDNRTAKLTILKLPVVRPTKDKFSTEALLLNYDGTEKRLPLNLNVSVSLPVTYIFQYAFNFCALLWFLINSKVKKFNICIGEPSTNIFIANILKFLGIVEYTVFMNGDIVPEVEKIKDSFYLRDLENTSIVRFIDKLLVRIQTFFRKVGMHSDLIWYSNEVTVSWDVSHGFKVANDKIVSQTVTIDSIGIEEKINISKDKNTLCYIGRLDELAGLDISLEALRYIKKEIPSVHLLIVGGDSITAEKYKKMAENLGISRNVTFYGFIPEMEDAYSILRRGRYGLALYKPDPLNVSLFAEPSKPKEYIKQGIPVVISRGGPEVGKVIEEFDAGVLVEYDPKLVADKIIFLLKDAAIYEKLKLGVLAFAKAYDYRPIFESFLSKLIEKYIESL